MAPELLRCATTQDLPVIVELKLAMFDEAGLMERLAEGAADMILQDYQRLYAEDRAAHFVIEHNGAIVAMVGAFLKSDLPFRYYKTPLYGFIGDVYCSGPGILDNPVSGYDAVAGRGHYHASAPQLHATVQDPGRARGPDQTQKHGPRLSGV